MKTGYEGWLRRLAMQTGYEGWLRRLAMESGYEGRLRRLAMQTGYKGRLRRLAMQTGYEGWLRREVTPTGYNAGTAKTWRISIEIISAGYRDWLRRRWTDVWSDKGLNTAHWWSVMTASSSPSFWVHWKAAADWAERKKKDWVANVNAYQTKRLSCPSRTAQYMLDDSVRFSLVLRHLCLSNDKNGWGTDNVGPCIVHRQGLLFQDRTMTWNT